MLISYQWLQTFFDTPLPPPEVVAEALTFHSSEIEDIAKVGTDTIFDVKVLPDNAAWLLSHRGIAKEVSVILDMPLTSDPLRLSNEVLPVSDQIHVTLTSPVCDYYTATLIEGVTVGPSPDWLREQLEGLGQKSINNIVDITNYVMLATGQPLHAFAAHTLAHGKGYAVGVRQAHSGEQFVSLTGEEYQLTPEDAVIVGGKDEVLALAGVKGGQYSGITDQTTSIVLEAAHFERTAVRKTAQRHKLPTDASKRYENGISRVLIPPSVALAVSLISKVAGGAVIGTKTVGEGLEVRQSVTVTLSQINSLLGLSLTISNVTTLLDRFGYSYEVQDDEEVTVTPPAERDDLTIPADLIEEIGRVYGLDKITSVPPELLVANQLNKRHYYAEVIRQTLVARGFSEVYTSSFRNQDKVRIQNALASDKGYLRSSLAENLREARAKNIPHRDLLGIPTILLFEIGTVFAVDTEEFKVCLAVQTNTTYKAKTDDVLWRTAIADLESVLQTSLAITEAGEGVVEFSLDAILVTLPTPSAYGKHVASPVVSYQPFSLYPAVSRDIALWVGEGVTAGAVMSALQSSVSADQLVRLTHLDTFTKDGRTSLAFRLVFQSDTKTFTGVEIDALMEVVYATVAKYGWEVR